MEALLIALRAAAEPTRLRILALAGRGAFCVSEFTEILGQSQPRLSRNLKLLCEAGLLERVREGANVWFAVPTEQGISNFGTVFINARGELETYAPSGAGTPASDFTPLNGISYPLGS